MRYVILCAVQWIAAAILLSLVRSGVGGSVEGYLLETTIVAVWNLPITLFLFRYLTGSTHRMPKHPAGP